MGDCGWQVKKEPQFENVNNNNDTYENNENNENNKYQLGDA